MSPPCNTLPVSSRVGRETFAIKNRKSTNVRPLGRQSSPRDPRLAIVLGSCMRGCDRRRIERMAFLGWVGSDVGLVGWFAGGQFRDTDSPNCRVPYVAA